MVSTATTRNRFNKQGTGDNTNTWGTKLNGEVFDLIDEALDGYVAVTVSGNVTLTSTNYVTDQARMRQLWLSGDGGYTVTIPGVQKFYIVYNACSAAVTFTAGGVTCSVPASQSRLVFTNGTDCYVSDDGASLAYVNATFLPLAGGTMTGNLVLTGDAGSALHAVPLQQLQAAVLSAAAGNLPALTGNTLKFLRVNAGETSVEWAAATLSSLGASANGVSLVSAADYAAMRALLDLEVNTDFAPVYAYSSMSGNVNPAVTYTHYGADSTTAARTITLPASFNGRLIVSDRDGNALTNNITIANGGNTIHGSVADYVIDKNYGWIELIASSAGVLRIARGG